MGASRVFNLGFALLAFVNAALWLLSNHYLITAMWSLAALFGVSRASTEWNRPPGAISANPPRVQLMLGAVLLIGVVAWWFLRGQ